MGRNSTPLDHKKCLEKWDTVHDKQYFNLKLYNFSLKVIESFSRKCELTYHFIM